MDNGKRESLLKDNILLSGKEKTILDDEHMCEE